MNSYFIKNNQLKSKMSLVLTLMKSGCTFDQIKIISGCKQDSIQEMISQSFGKSVNMYENMRKYLSDEQCLRMWLMINKLNDELSFKLIKQLLYPSFICIFTYVSMLFFKLTLLQRIQSMFEIADSNLILIGFNTTLVLLTMIYMTIFITLIFLKISLNNPNSRNFFYKSLHLRFKDNILTVYTTGLFSRMLNECIKSGISTQKSLEMLGRNVDFPFVAFLASNCSNKLNEGNSFNDSISSIETDSSFKIYMQLGFYEINVISQLSNYCEFNTEYLSFKLKRLIDCFTVFVYFQFSISVILLYQVIQIPMTALGSMI